MRDVLPDVNFYALDALEPIAVDLELVACSTDGTEVARPKTEYSCTGYREA